MVQLTNQTMCGSLILFNFPKKKKRDKFIYFSKTFELQMMKMPRFFVRFESALVAFFPPLSDCIYFSEMKHNMMMDRYEESGRKMEKIDRMNLPVDNPLSRSILLIRFHVLHDWCGAVGTAVFCCCWRVWWTTTMARHLAGRTAGCQRDGDVHGRVEEWQKGWIWHQRTIRRTQVRGRVVQQQEIRLWRHYTQGMHPILM